MEDALGTVVRPVSSTVVAQWLKSLGKEYMDKHEKVLAAEEESWRKSGASTANLRRPAAAGEPKRPRARPTSSPGGDEAASSTPPPSTPPPSAPPHRGPYALVALLSLLVVALAIGIVVVARSSGDPAMAPAVALPAGAPAAEPEASPAPAAKPSEGAAATDRAATAISIGEAETSPTRAASRPSAVRPPAQRSAARAAPPVRSSSSAKAAAAGALDPGAQNPPPAETRPGLKDSCTPPYYFDGTKKIFKPACL
jgi:hypothetical protein